MNTQNIDNILESQRKFFQSGVTLPVSFRIEMLKKLRDAVNKYEGEITDALKSDLGKSSSESYMCEIGMVLSEITYMLRHIKKFAAKQYVATPLAQFASVSYKQPTPYGNTLIMSPWNYPFLLTLDPLVNAIAAGNTAIVKPSAYSPATGEVVKRLLEECYSEEYVAVVTGGRKENAVLLDKKFDFIFFTGSTTVGKEVLRRAAEHVTPVVLELGGKSPCIVEKTCKIDLSARRIVFGKFVNCGQTCVAPDYILCDSSIRDELVEAITKEIHTQFGQRPLENENYGKIINEKHFHRLLGLINPEKIVTGGSSDKDACRIEPTVMVDVTWDDAVMQEEIFGPILPIITFDTLDQAIAMIESHPHPLALYCFTEDKKVKDRILTKCRFGGGCINDCIIHLATSELPFGGVGDSGMGRYHGKFGFEEFSHIRSIVDKKTWLDLDARYQPYTEKNLQLMRNAMK